MSSIFLAGSTDGVDCVGEEKLFVEKGEKERGGRGAGGDGEERDGREGERGEERGERVGRKGEGKDRKPGNKSEERKGVGRAQQFPHEEIPFEDILHGEVSMLVSETKRRSKRKSTKCTSQLETRQRAVPLDL